MKKIPKPKNNIEIILKNCMEHMQDPRKNRIIQVKDTIVQKTTEYDLLADYGELYKIQAHDNIDSIATKEDMEALYTQKFVSKDGLNREIYDKLILMAPNGKCPYCQQNLVKTLDHFLPKAKYITYTVTPYNLVPSCTDCNKDKSVSAFDSYERQPFHPYYDDFDDSVWLKAKLIEKEPISFQFYADPPPTLSTEKMNRIKHSFSDQGFGLNNIYRSHAPGLYRTCFHRIKILYEKGGKPLAIARLQENIEDEQAVSHNSWKAAMYQAMIESEWYWETYMPSIVKQV